MVIVGGVLGDRAQQAPVAELLAPGFAVSNQQHNVERDAIAPALA